MPRLSVVLSLIALPGTALAEAPRVVVDTAPLHALVSRVMAGVGTPDLLLPPGTSPHDFALRPSDAARLSGAEVLIWTGPALAPWLAEAAPTLAPGAATLALLESPGWTALPRRDDPRFEMTDASHDHGEIDDPATDAADDDHGEHDGHEDHDDHGPTDPHAWLDPTVAADWADLAAAHLAAADPANAALYADNAAALRADLSALDAEIAARLVGLNGNYVVPHDAFQYFEVRHGLPAVAAITLSDAAAPGLAHVAELREALVAGEVVCLLTDPETNPDLATQLAEGSGARIALVDADGVHLTPGPDLYRDLMTGLADALVDCLGPS